MGARLAFLSRCLGLAELLTLLLFGRDRVQFTLQARGDSDIVVGQRKGHLK